MIHKWLQASWMIFSERENSFRSHLGLERWSNYHVYISMRSYACLMEVSSSYHIALWFLHSDNEILEDNLRSTEKSFTTANEIFNEMWLSASHYRIINLIWKRLKNLLRLSSVQLWDRRTCIKMLLLSLRELCDKGVCKSADEVSKQKKLPQKHNLQSWQKWFGECATKTPILESQEKEFLSLINAEQEQPEEEWETRK